MPTDPVPSSERELPPHYRRALGVLVRFAAAMTIVGLLAGVLFQESSKKLEHDAVGAGLHLQATLRLALLHGHVLTSAVLVPLACAGALLIARRAGGRELGPRPIAWLLFGYLPLLGVTLILMLLKGYHVLLAVRGGDHDLAAIDERFLAGAEALRHGVYGVAHAGMAISLGVFMVALWRSLSARAGTP